MPYQNGRFTPGERAFVEPMARTGDAPYAAAKAGLAVPEVAGYKLMARPAVRAAVLKRSEEIMFDELLPLALTTIKDLMAPTIPSGTRLGAAKLAIDRTMGVMQEAHDAKEPSEMSYDELQASIAALRAEQAAREEGAVDVTPPALDVSIDEVEQPSTASILD